MPLPIYDSTVRPEKTTVASIRLNIHVRALAACQQVWQHLSAYLAALHPAGGVGVT